MGAAWCLSCRPWKMGLGRGDAERAVASMADGFIIPPPPKVAGGGGIDGGRPATDAGSYVVAPPGGIEEWEAAAEVACRWSEAVVRG
jgi:hypothetical protein